MKKIINSLATKAPSGVAILCSYCFMYYTFQQYIRLSANETPMQYAMEVKYRLEAGVGPANALNNLPLINMANSLMPFAIIYNKNGLPLGGSAQLNGGVPVPPKGVFDVALQKEENRVTWQPEHGVRIATVILPYTINGQSGYVLAGKSLRETEERERFVFMQIAGGAVITLIATFVMTIIINFFRTP